MRVQSAISTSEMDVIVARDQILMDATRLVESHVFFEFNTINLIATYSIPR